MTKLTTKLILAAAMCLPLALPADVLILDNGSRLEGRIENGTTTRDRVAFISGAGRIELPVGRIAERIEEEDWEDWTRVAGQYLENKDYTQAIQTYQQALEANPDYEPALEGLSQAQAGLSSRQEENARQAREELLTRLETVPDLIENEAFAEAEQIINNTLAGDVPEDTNLMARRLLRDLYLAWGFARYDKLDYRGAEERYLRVLEMDPNNEDAQDRLLSIWERDPNKRQEVLQTYLNKLDVEPNNLEYNRKAADLLYSFQRYEAAIEPLRKVVSSNRYPAQGYDKKLENSYWQTVQEFKRDGDLDEAINLFEELLQVFPTHNDTELVVLRYQRDREQLAEDDYEGWATLVRRLYEAGLTEYAVREAELVLRYAPESELASEILRQDARRELERVEQTFAEGNYLVARDMAFRFMERGSRFPELIQQAEELYNRADIEARRQAKENRERAREIAQRGMQYYQEAMNYVALLNSTDQRQGARPISYKQEAIDRSRRAIDHYQTALRIDPSLGGIEGMDLNSRLRDAQNLYRNLTDRPAPLPRVRNRS